MQVHMLAIFVHLLCDLPQLTNPINVVVVAHKAKQQCLVTTVKILKIHDPIVHM